MPVVGVAQARVPQQLCPKDPPRRRTFFDRNQGFQGTLLTSYQKALSEAEFRDLLATYSREVIATIGEGPYFYGFKRMLIWGKRKA